MSDILTLENLKQIEAKYIPQEKQGKYGLRTLLLQVVESHKLLLSAYEDACTEREMAQQYISDLRTGREFIISMPRISGCQGSVIQ